MAVAKYHTGGSVEDPANWAPVTGYVDPPPTGVAGLMSNDGDITWAPKVSLATSTVTGAHELLNNSSDQVLVNTSSAVDVTIGAANSFQVGDCVIVRQTGTGQVTIVADAGVTLHTPNGSKTAEQWGTVTVSCVGENTFVVDGNPVV